jgi:four helix bundle protein
MVLKLEDLRVLKSAEIIADNVWEEVSHWDSFAKKVVGSQFARATDSIGANIAESFGRYHYGEKIQFLYYARGSLFEAKYWLNRAVARQLIASELAQRYAAQLTEEAIQINSFVKTIKKNRPQKKGASSLKEPGPVYLVDDEKSIPNIFSSEDLAWIATDPENQ